MSLEQDQQRKNEQIKRRAEKARQLLAEPLVKEALDEMETAVVNNIALCPPEKEALQQKLCMLLGVIRRFRQILVSHMESGNLVDFELEQKKKRFGIF